VIVVTQYYMFGLILIISLKFFDNLNFTIELNVDL